MISLFCFIVFYIIFYVVLEELDLSQNEYKFLEDQLIVVFWSSRDEITMEEEDEF